MKDVPSEGRAAQGEDTKEGRLLAGRYRLTKRIDEGGAGEVWQARDERLDRDVAIKILGPTADEAFRERFADEARRAASVLHPNVVTVFDEGRDGVDAFMVMELVRGRTLRDVVADRGRARPNEAARRVAQIAAALAAAHEAGVIHCDVKPANVIVDQQGPAKLTGCGIARAARGPREHELIGTARYIAPERIEGRAPTERSDVYSLGLVAYELITGRPPNAEMETEDLLRVRLDGRPPSLRSARVGISEEIDRVVAKALARDPQGRYASAGAFARDLLAASQHDDATGVRPPLPRRRQGLQREVTGLTRMATGVKTDTGRVRDGNEDRYLVREERGVTLLAVADGVGGSSGGEIAADAAMVELGLRFFGAPPDRATSDALAEAMRDANAAVLRAAISSGHRDAATTIVAAAVRADQAIIANLGDSRAYLIRDGVSRQLTEDHSGEAAHAITRFAGDVRGIQPDIFVETLRPADRLLLCSDGLTRHVTPEEIAKVASGEDVRTAANALVDLANARGGQDNITVLLHAPGRSATVTLAAGRAAAFVVFALLILVTVGGAVAVLFAASSVPPATSARPSPVH